MEGSILGQSMRLDKAYKSSLAVRTTTSRKGDLSRKRNIVCRRHDIRTLT